MMVLRPPRLSNFSGMETASVCGGSCEFGLMLPSPARSPNGRADSIHSKVEGLKDHNESGRRKPKAKVRERSRETGYVSLAIPSNRKTWMIRDSEAETHFDAAALDGRSLSQVFNDFIFEDPEVKRLGEIAVAKCPAFSRVLRGGAFYMYGVDAWPLGKNHTADLCSSERGPVGWLADPDPPELTKARLAIQKRFHEILRLLRGGELSAWGINAKTRQREQIPTAIFSHRRFWLKTNEFDLYYLSTAVKF
jgi:hypothetical protein